VVNFGKKTNAIKTAKVKYRVAKTDEWSTGQDIVLTVADGKFSYNGAITGDLESKGFNISNSYEVEVIVTDELSSVTFTDTFSSGTPNIAYHKNGISVMGKYDVEEGGAFQINGVDYFKYDEDERVIGTWEDGKAIYRKVIDIGALPNAGQKIYEHSIPVDTPIRCIGICYNPTSSMRFTLPMANIDIWGDTTNIMVSTTTDRSALTGKAIFEYTKTTD
jgi:hypothetical protein